MKNATASNWVAETCVATDSGFTLKGTSKGYTSFSDAFESGDQVFYSVHDSNGNRNEPPQQVSVNDRHFVGSAQLVETQSSHSSLSRLRQRAQHTRAAVGRWLLNEFVFAILIDHRIKRKRFRTN